MEIPVNVDKRLRNIRPGYKGPARRLVFNNNRELWQLQRAAKVFNIPLNTYIRAVTLEHSERVLAGGDENERGERK